MSGLLALLDDVAGIAKVAAASVDDVAGQAAQAGAKAAGAVIDDAAVAPKYVQGFAAARELPIVGKIALGSIRNKIVLLLPAALLLSAFAPGAITPLLMLGGSYLCFEGAEKVLGALRHPAGQETESTPPPLSAEHLEAAKVRGAVKTDFILSAEIMTIALAALPAGQTVLSEAMTLVLVALGMTALVYGGVAVIVKADDVGLWLAGRGRLWLTRALGRGLVRLMPGAMRGLTLVGTAAMLWVGGNIVLHGAAETFWDVPYEAIHRLAMGLTSGLPGSIVPAASWGITALCDGIFGVLWGAALIPVAERIVDPLIERAKGIFRR